MRVISGVLVTLAIFAVAFAFDFEDWTSDESDTFFPESLESRGQSGNSERIIGGNDAVEGQYPYQAGLLMNKSGSGSWCGGVLISKDYLLTAAHCAINADSIRVYLGGLSIRQLQNETRAQIVAPRENIVVHAGYNPSRISNDIAIIRLPQPVNITDNIKPIALPKYSDAGVDFAYSTVVASGWGRTNDIAGSTISDTLRFAEVRVQPESVCKYFFGASILPSNICTETGYGQGICNGDSGGPVAGTRSDGTRVILGLSSFVSSRGCVKCWPSVFVRVSYFLDWIAQNSDIKIEI